jgi:diguanylate cyclase (GGDEF)-like protein
MTWTTILDELAEGQDVVRVLLVEDDPGDRRLVEEMLHDTDEGAVLTSCARLEDALDPVSRGLADLVLLDLSLPDSFGVDGVRRLRAAAPEIPVVVLSGLDDKQVALEAVQAGAQDYLTKDNVDGETLTKAMRYAVERQRSERRLVRLALSDPLTGLPNRILFADRLEQALARAARSVSRSRRAPRMLLMFIDLDGFKAVNDTLGHLAGDEVLVEVARRLNDEVRDSDTVARLGGDEFTVLCEGVQGDEGGVALARRIANVLSHPYETEAGEARLSAAIGIAVASPMREDGAALLRRADAAMYEAKREGAGRVAVASGP